MTGNIVSCDHPNTSDDSIIRISTRICGVPSVKRTPSFRSARGEEARRSPEGPNPRRKTMCALDTVSASAMPT